MMVMIMAMAVVEAMFTIVSSRFEAVIVMMARTNAAVIWRISAVHFVVMRLRRQSCFRIVKVLVSGR